VNEHVGNINKNLSDRLRLVERESRMSILVQPPSKGRLRYQSEGRRFLQNSSTMPMSIQVGDVRLDIDLLFHIVDKLCMYVVFLVVKYSLDRIK
jgi:hypothetical protein